MKSHNYTILYFFFLGWKERTQKFHNVKLSSVSCIKHCILNIRNSIFVSVGIIRNKRENIKDKVGYDDGLTFNYAN